MPNNIFLSLADYFIEFDRRLEANILDFICKYSFPTQNAPFLKENIITFIKISIYSMFLIIPMAILKVIKRESRLVFFLFAITLVAFVASTFGIFLGFFQLLFI
jgi:hypothetical protein